MDLIKDKFLKGLWDKTSEAFETAIMELEKQGSAFNQELGAELNRRIKELREIYHRSAINPPRYVVISYHRSSLLDDYPWFQISIYDEDYFYSGRECSVWLETPVLSSYLSQIMDEVNQEFKRQTRVEEYYKDEFLITYGDKFYQWLRKRMRKIIEIHVFTGDWEQFYLDNEINIMFGEYKNQVVRIY